MRILKQSTAATVLIGPFVDKTDGVTEEAGLATTGTELSKAGAAFGAGPTLGTLDSDGWYPIALTVTHTNTLGDLTVKVHDAATHLPVWAHFTVLPAAVYDALVSGTGAGIRADVSDKTGYALTSGERDSIAAALLDLVNAIETGLTVRQAFKLLGAALGGKSTGGPGSPVYRNTADTVNRITATVDANGDRSAVTLNL